MYWMRGLLEDAVGADEETLGETDEEAAPSLDDEVTAAWEVQAPKLRSEDNTRTRSNLFFSIRKIPFLKMTGTILVISKEKG